ncbi:hypothetical protein BKA62DRAFT_704528 [Auriculariales sp. MPI-PUGE-AT-0066]|nr:hypothetical protein BKA62DRAFT_704528 [Auriculariales sp. MPI-PUGE-AT-0066]
MGWRFRNTRHPPRLWLTGQTVESFLCFLCFGTRCQTLRVYQTGGGDDDRPEEHFQITDHAQARARSSLLQGWITPASARVSCNGW